MPALPLRSCPCQWQLLLHSIAYMVALQRASQVQLSWEPTWGHLPGVHGPAAATCSRALVPALARWARLARLPRRRVLTRRQAHHVCVRLLIVVFGVRVLSCIGPAKCHRIQSM